MQIGIGMPNALPGADRDLFLNWVQAAENGPFASLAVLDRIVYDSYEPMATLAMAAGLTQRIRLASLILIGPFRQTALLAKQAATIDALSGGRLTLGLGLGARKDDYDLTNGDFHSRGRILTEQLRELRRYWKEKAFGPKPVQTYGPELLVGGMSDATFKRMARHADGYVHGGGPAKVFARFADKARQAWSAQGRSGQPQLWGTGYFALGKESVQVGRNYLLHYYAFTGAFAEKIAGGLLSSSEAVAEYIESYRAAGCDHLVLFPTRPDIGQVGRLAEVVSQKVTLQGAPVAFSF